MAKDAPTEKAAVLLSSCGKGVGSTWTDTRPEEGMLGIFKDVRFYPILNFGHIWAPLFSRCFYPIMNFGHFWAPPRL